MNSEMPKTPRQELEATLTALLLGELPTEKAAALRELIAKDPELAPLYERLKQTIGLVRETAVPAEQGTQSAPLKLSTKRREQLLQHFKTIAPKEFAKPKSRTIRVRELAIARASLRLSALLPGSPSIRHSGHLVLSRGSRSLLKSNPGGLLMA